MIRIAAALAVVLGMVAPQAAQAALPAIVVPKTTRSMDGIGAHRGITVTATCPSGRLVGGGSFLRVVADPDFTPTNGLVLGGTMPSTGASPVDLPAPNGSADPGSWAAISNYTGASAFGDQASAFGMCATSEAPSHVSVVTASTTGINATQQVNPPNLTIATCPGGTTLIGGGAFTHTPDQVDDGTTVGNNGNLKPLADYPSDAAGLAAADGSTTATSWTAYGAAGIPTAVDVVTALALCSSDAAFNAAHPIQIVRRDVNGPSSGFVTTPVTCPGGTRLLGGGYRVDSGAGLQPQQGYHLRGSFPSDAAGREVAHGAANPGTWTTVLQAGGQSDSNSKLKAFAICAQDATPAPAPVATTGGSGAVGDASAVVSGTLNPNGLATTYVFEYGTTTAFGSISAPVAAGEGSSAMPVGAPLTGLQSTTTYLYRLVAASASGTTYGAVRSFTTGPGGAPLATTGAATSVTASGATLAATVDARGLATAFTFEYGTTTSFGAISAVDRADPVAGVQSVALPIAGLQPATTYLYRIVATNALGTTAGAVGTFTTNGEPPI